MAFYILILLGENKTWIENYKKYYFRINVAYWWKFWCIWDNMDEIEFVCQSNEMKKATQQQQQDFWWREECMQVIHSHNLRVLNIVSFVVESRSI